MAKYDQDKIFLQRILDSVTKMRDELETRLEELDEQRDYLTHAIDALSVYEHVNSLSEVTENA